MARKLRAGLVGLGMMGRHHARVLKSLPGVELVAVVDPQGDPHHVAGQFDVLSTIEELLAVGVDYCTVAVPTVAHLPVGLALADAGVHTLIEKPLAPTGVEGEHLVQAFRAAGVIGAVGHIERYNPALQALRSRLEAGGLGEIYQVQTRRQGPFPARIADVGVVMDLATHDIDSTTWVTGSNFSAVAARTVHRSGREHEDLVTVTGQLENGTVSSHLVNWLTPCKERLTIITGERGMYVADTLSSDLTFFENGSVEVVREDLAQFRGVTEGDVTRYAIPKPEPLRLEHEAMRDAVLGVSNTVVDIAEGLATVRTADALLMSATTGETIRVADINEMAGGF